MPMEIEPHTKPKALHLSSPFLKTPLTNWYLFQAETSRLTPAMDTAHKQSMKMDGITLFSSTVGTQHH